MDKQTDQARELITQDRLQEELRQEGMVTRSEAELQSPSRSSLEEKARQAMADQLHQEEQSQQTMRERSQEELHQA
ncbi:MAG: hypothetical protein VKO01_12630 [Cyanobacteriota bacterium]|nr:hypothetical protein [Cyanobacteriota bacterium]